MTEAIPHPVRRIVIVGGGITGLAAAHRCQELACERGLYLELLLVESGPRLGGVLRTERRDGFLLEAGPDSFITQKPWALDLCRRLGLEAQLIGTDPTHRRSFVARGRRLLPVPEGFQLLAPSRLWPFVASPIFSWRGKLRMGLDWILPARSSSGDESLGQFVERRLGREALERMAQPMIAGIYGADPHNLSLQATLPRFQEMERRHGSLIRAMIAQNQANGQRSGHAGVSGARYGLFVTLQSGMQSLVDALAERLPPGSVRLGTSVSRLFPQEDGSWRVSLAGLAGPEEELTADAVCLALPSHRAANLISRFDSGLAARLANIHYASVMTLNLAYRREAVPHPLDGFGFVVPAVERRALLGCTFSSVKFAGRAPEGHVLLRAFLAGSSLMGREDTVLVDAVRRDLRDLLGVDQPPLFTSLYRQRQAMAQYDVGHLEHVAAIEADVARHPGLALAGNAYRGIGIPDCVQSGEQAAERLVAVLSSARAECVPSLVAVEA
jgi:protoporphyrinogen/coproporphyrinogen III oxidase